MSRDEEALTRHWIQKAAEAQDILDELATRPVPVWGAHYTYPDLREAIHLCKNITGCLRNSPVLNPDPR